MIQTNQELLQGWLEVEKNKQKLSTRVNYYEVVVSPLINCIPYCSSGMVTLPCSEVQNYQRSERRHTTTAAYSGMTREISSYPMTGGQGPSQEVCHFPQQYFIFLHRKLVRGWVVFGGRGCSKMGKEYEESKIHGTEKIQGTCSRHQLGMLTTSQFSQHSGEPPKLCLYC